MNDRLELESDEAQGEPRAIPRAEGKLIEPPAKMKCSREFGYLSKRESKGEIPEECMICENIVQCMLKTITG